MTMTTFLIVADLPGGRHVIGQQREATDTPLDEVLRQWRQKHPGAERMWGRAIRAVPEVAA